MGQNSTIEWTHHTFNPWWGCAKVSPACAHCYAEAWAKRTGHAVWGNRSERRFFGETHWREPIKWNNEAIAKGERRRVFCASMADVFERRADLNESRRKLWALIEATPALDWLLLTKRPWNISKMVPWGAKWPGNVWLGTTVENQNWAEKRIPALLENPSVVRFLSCEPLLGEVSLSGWNSEIHWVIAGGESGPGARPMHPDWARSLRDQCTGSKIPFHFKQWGHWVPTELSTVEGWGSGREVDFEGARLIGLGKKAAGRILDGKTWDEFPRPIAA